MIVPKSSLAFLLLACWLFGDGSTLYFGDSSVAADSFRSSPGMNAICKEALEEYKKTGEQQNNKQAQISGIMDFDVWMAARSFDYSIDITERKYTEGFLWWRKEKVEYTLTITIHDTYDFNSATDSGDGLGSWLNNKAYALHEKGYGTDYEWYVTYTKKYNSPNQKRRNLIGALFSGF